MPLTKDQKREQVAAISDELDAYNTVYLTDYIGLSVDEVTKLRRAFREAGVQYKVFKNTLVRRALEEKGGFDELFGQLSGPTAMAFTNDAAGPAKVIKKFLGQVDKGLPRFKGAFVDGAVFDEEQLDVLFALKSRDELLGDVLSLLLAPITNVISGVQAQGSNLLGAVKAIAEQAEA